MACEVDCVCHLFERIDGFQILSEFQRFQGYIAGLIKDGELFEVQAKKKYAGFSEQWFKCNGCNQIWRLVHPDFPFKGLWERLN